MLLAEASCKSCEAVINSGFERHLAQVALGDVRFKHGTRSRHRKKGRGAPTTKTVASKWGGTFEVPLADYPASFAVFEFGTATMLTGGPDQPVDGNGWWETRISSDDRSGEATAAFKAKYPDWDELFELRLMPQMWARLAAKVAYGTAICHYGVDAFDEEVTPIILGQEPLFSRRVGGDREGYLNQAEADPGFSFKLVSSGPRRFHLVMDHRMFAGDGLPRYHVVVGTVDLTKPEHLAAFSEGRSGGRWLEAPPTPLIGPVKPVGPTGDYFVWDQEASRQANRAAARGRLVSLSEKFIIVDDDEQHGRDTSA